MAATVVQKKKKSKTITASESAFKEQKNMTSLLETIKPYNTPLKSPG